LPLLKLINILLKYLIVSEKEANHTKIKHVSERTEHLCNGYCLPESGFVEPNQSRFIPIFQAGVSQPGAELHVEPVVREIQAE
jgi:hypothetical protein